MESDILKVLVPDLLAASRDKNTTIRVMAETALISSLALRDGDHKLEVYIGVILGRMLCNRPLDLSNRPLFPCVL